MAGQTDKVEIGRLLEEYNKHLNAGESAAIVSLYSEDGVLMAQHTPTAVGTDAVRAAYERTFTAISPAVTFAVQEIVLISSEYAFARATAKGVIKAGGADHKAENQELFVLKKEGGEWKIARYCFSTMLPPSALGELHKSTW